MITPNDRALLYGIILNCPTSVLACLKKKDTNVDAVLHLGDLDPNSYHAKILKPLFPDLKSISVTPLHLSVLMCHQGLVIGRGEAERESRADKILLRLLEHGAEPNQYGNLKSMTLADTLSSHLKSRFHLDSIQPYELAHCLMQHTDSIEKEQRMKRVVNLFEKDTLKMAERMVHVRGSVAMAWKRLLFSEPTSDVHFVCNDGTVLHAHKCILAASTPFFERYFEGPWGLAHADGNWHTENSPEVMRFILRFLYTGEMDQEVLESNPEALFVIASEYEIMTILVLVEHACIQSLCQGNIASFLVMGYLHDSKSLYYACINFLAENRNMLKDPSIKSLSKDNPDLWKEVQTAIESRKRKIDAVEYNGMDDCE